MSLQRRLDQAELDAKAGGVSRRTFLVTSAAAGGGLLVGFALPRFIDVKAATPAGDNFAPNAFIRIGADDSVTLVMPQVEMGQGTYTSMSMLIAEELEVELAHRRFHICTGLVGAAAARGCRGAYHAGNSGSQ
jgi:isoquinoline 1-oxidoreductase beta subunit